MKLEAARPQRPPVMATTHLAASGHYLTAQVGFQILEAGGNAIDAGVAMGLATGVVECQFVGIGGIAPIMIYMSKTGEVVTFAGVGGWPQAASCDYFQRNHGGRIPDGLLQSVVPAAAGTWIAALERHGTMTFPEVAQAAIRFARDGFPMYAMLRDRLVESEKTLRNWPSSAAVFLPGGRVPELGERFVQADLGASLKYMADQAAACGKSRKAGLQAAHDAFYKGDIAAAIVKQQKELGGLLTHQDLADFRAPAEPPTRSTFGDIDLYGMGPLSQGPMVLQALNILDGCNLGSMTHNSAEYVHHVVEALKLAAADREAYCGDPAFVDVPLKTLLSKDYAAARRKLLRANEAWPGLPPHGDVGSATPAPWTADPSSKPKDSGLNTSYFCVMDSDGNVFSATPSDGLMKAPIVPGTGLCASMWGSRGYTNPRHPSCVAPGKRPKMSSNPAIAIRPGKMVMPFGSPGSEVLGQAMLQAFLNATVFGMDPQSAVEAPRFASYSWPASTLPHTYKPGHLNLEAPIGETVAKDLAKLGHTINWWPERKWSAGSVCMIVADPSTGLKIGGADHRRTAYAVGW